MFPWMSPRNKSSCSVLLNIGLQTVTSSFGQMHGVFVCRDTSAQGMTESCYLTDTYIAILTRIMQGVRLSEVFVPALWATLTVLNFFLLVHLTPQKLSWKATAAKHPHCKLLISGTSLELLFSLAFQTSDLPTAMRLVEKRVSCSYKKMVFLKQLPDLL